MLSLASPRARDDAEDDAYARHPEFSIAFTSREHAPRSSGRDAIRSAGVLLAH